MSINYDEIFVNGKQVGSTIADAFKDIKDKLFDVISFDKNTEHKEPDDTGEKVPLLGDDKKWKKLYHYMLSR